jgi:hypothetical protein
MSQYTCPKSPLAPPFDYAQDMLFQEGNTLRCANSPLKKGELRGIFLANGECNFTKTSIAKLQEFENTIITDEFVI